MPAEDYFPSYYELDWEIEPDDRHRKTCAFCGERDLHWGVLVSAPSGFALFNEDGDLHRCLYPPALVENFPLVNCSPGDAP